MNWIAQKFGELVTKVDDLFTSHSSLELRVAALEKELAEPPAPAPQA